jgi:hypothetical protein
MRGVGVLGLLLVAAASTPACQHESEPGDRGVREDSAVSVVVTQLASEPVHRHIRHLGDAQPATYGLVRLAFSITNTSEENVVVGRCSGSALDAGGGTVYGFAPVHVIDDDILLRPGESRKGVDYEPRIRPDVRAAAIRTVDRLEATCAAYPWEGPPPIHEED